MDTPKIGIIAAMEREVWDLVKYWTRRRLTHAGNDFDLFENSRAALICGGIGGQSARLAAEALLANVGLECLTSAGFAGSLAGDLRAGAPFRPAEIIEAESGQRYLLPAGKGLLATASGVLGAEEKAQLAMKYGARAVDMEAASVARVAQQHGVPFLALKAISDEQGVAMPPVEKFVDARGRFQTGRFVLHTAVRPAGWAAVGHLAAASARASRTLCDMLADVIQKPDGAQAANRR